MKKNPFIEIVGSNSNVVSINVHFITRFEPAGYKTNIYVQEGNNVVFYPADIHYDDLKGMIDRATD
ncbi:hypothetical protein DYU05_04020 [Mucilaginibacter terrenus]|uniref:Uncharacterized protein n=1 Tax=Mucilaginibacter terrenus TaxID=2482727 RepID=A0A3E2NUV8_9SPHI|nr:hypothetical protein [Mucilaginibacter terrenus]RFZ84782.1 hypothetical protein DYU05_04020 [Mucilaginibacter terrenus]